MNPLLSNPMLREWLESRNTIGDYDFLPLTRVKFSKQKKEEFNLTVLFEKAMDQVLTGRPDIEVAEFFELDIEELREQINKFNLSGTMKYIYNVTGRIFSYKEELILLEMLMTIPETCCICQSCSRERLPFLAYHVIRQEGKLYPAEWDEEQKADIDWQTNFETEYVYEIAHTFPTVCKTSESDCIVEEDEDEED